MQRIANYEDEQLGRGDCSAKCLNFSATEKNRRRIAPKLANEREEGSGESDNEWARMRRSPERSHSQGTTHATSFTANYCLSLQRAAQNTNSNTITTASANQITNTNGHCENKWYNCRPLASQPKEDLKGKTRILFTSPYQGYSAYLIFVNFGTPPHLLKFCKSTPKSGQRSQHRSKRGRAHIT